MFLALHGCWLACDTWIASRYFLYKHAFQNMSWKRGSMEIVKKRYDDKTRFEAVASGSSCSAIFHVNETSRHVMILMHQQHRNEATA